MILSLNISYSKEHGINKPFLKNYVCICAAIEPKHTITCFSVGYILVSVIVDVLCFVIVYFYTFIFNMGNVSQYNKIIYNLILVNFASVLYYSN